MASGYKAADEADIGRLSDPSSGRSDGKSQRAEQAGYITRRLAEITGTAWAVLPARGQIVMAAAPL
jgi:hypothetical protein